MSNWIFLSKNKADPFINQFAAGCGVEPIDTEKFNYDKSTDPLCFRGILKKKIIKQCWNDQRDFYFMDTGYFGNEVSEKNPMGFKNWHRIVRNNLQHSSVIKRPSDRWQMIGRKINGWKKEGSKILIAAPDEKPCKFYNIELDQWLIDTVKTIKANTDRPIEIRQRSKLRVDRTLSNTLQQALDNDVFALVTYNSNAATEAILYGIPAFVLAPVSAALPVSLSDITKIETPRYPSQDEVFEWACHLAYGQFNTNELKTGKAKRLLEEWW